MYDEIKSELKTLLTGATGGIEVPFFAEIGSMIMANNIEPLAVDLAKAEQAGGFGHIFRNKGDYPFFADFTDFVRGASNPLIEFCQTFESKVDNKLRSEQFAALFEASGKTAKNSVVALLLRFFGWVARSVAKWLQGVFNDEPQPTATESKIGVLLAEVRTTSGPDDLRFDRTPFRAVVGSLAAEGRPFTPGLVFEDLRTQIELFRESLAGRSFPVLAREANLASSTVRKLFSARLSVGVTIGTLARVAAALDVPLLGVAPVPAAPDVEQDIEQTATETGQTPATEPEAAAEAPDSEAPEPQAPDAKEPDAKRHNDEATYEPRYRMVEYRPPRRPPPVDAGEVPAQRQLATRAREFVETTRIFDSDKDGKLDADHPETILAVLRHIRREARNAGDLGIEDAQKYKLARHLWSTFRCATGIDTSLNVEATERLIPEIDAVFSTLERVYVTRVEVRNFVGSNHLTARLSRPRLARITGVDTTKWPAPDLAPNAAGVDKLTGAKPCSPVGRDFVGDLFAVASKAQAESAVLAEVQQLREQLASLTAKVNTHFTH